MKPRATTLIPVTGAALAALAALACASATAASSPVITLAHSFSGAVTNQTAPTFTGTTNDILDLVSVKIYAGASVTGSPPVQTLTTLPVPFKLKPLPAEGTWSTATPSPLKSGQYTALAEQTDPIIHTIKSPAVQFTVDATPPAVVIGAPGANAILSVSRPTFSGTAGQAQGDRQSVKIAIYAGDSASGTPVVAPVELAPVGGAWSDTGPQLPNGIYTAQVSQSDELGNVGSSTVTFAIIVPSPGSSAPAPTLAASASSAGQSGPSSTSGSAPVASFRWFPAKPRTGEQVVLASTSTDPDSAITGFSWDLAGSDDFKQAGSALTTSFASPGTHVVHLRVNDAHGLTSVASASIRVSRAAPTLMQPFPVVRIADEVHRLRATVSLLTVQAPVGSTVTATCQGPGCPAQSRDAVPTSQRANSKSGGVVTIVFRRFERALKAGASLQIDVAQPGRVGKYTRFTVRRGKLPVRTDSCLSATAAKPIACPR